MSELGDVPLADRAVFRAQSLVRLLSERRAPYRSPAAIERAQRRRLRLAVEHAIEQVPHYREANRRLGLGPADFETAADLAKLPLIEREDLQRDPEYFVSEAQPRGGRIELRSGGSTGVPVTVQMGARELVDRTCITLRARSAGGRATGRSWRRRVALILPPKSNSSKVVGAARRSGTSVLELRLRHIEISMASEPAEALAAVNAFRPDVIVSYGSYIEALFTHAVRRGRSFHRPKLVNYGADSISPGARKLLEDLGIEVLSGYGAIETPMVGFECERHRGHHINIDVCPLRIVDDDGRELPPGESGDVVVSDLINRATVLLNYRLGDVATAIPEPCDCGRNLPLLSHVQGRTDEWTVGRDGRPIHPQVLVRPFSLDHEVWGYRIEQLAPGHFTAQLVPAKGAKSGGIRARVRERFASIVGPDEHIEISLVDSLPRTGGGKVKRVVQVGDSI
jgi:phenylacetate-coenzyme A ligase PaaK-like adenylate-forming protein